MPNLKHFVKGLSISAGLYRPARNLYRRFNQYQSEQFHSGSAFYSRLLPPDALCFDVGANIGEQTEILLDVGSRVIAFEPQPECVREIKARCGHYGDNFSAIQSAVGAESGEATLYMRERNAVSSLHRDWEDDVKTCIQVPVITLDLAIAKFGKPYYCKIDVEGWELEVLKGLTQPVPLLSFEYHLSEREVQTTRACIEYLANLGEISVNITPSESLAFAFQDWLSYHAFLKQFPISFQSSDEYVYGNIWVRTS